MKVLIFNIQRFNRENDTVITRTSENDNLYNTGSNGTIDAGDGRDHIQNGFSAYLRKD